VAHPSASSDITTTVSVVPTARFTPCIMVGLLVIP
jgi:hypothetical protein